MSDHGDDEGASPKEQILEACRRDNMELFENVLNGMQSKTKEEIAEWYNKLTDVMGLHLLHICAKYGAYDVMDALLDIQYLECDPLTPRNKETPLHLCIEYAIDRDVELGTAMAKMAIDAGCDPRVKDKYGRTPRDLVNMSDEPGTEDLKDMLQKEEYVATEGLRNGDGNAYDDDDDVPEGHNSASDSE